MEIIQALIISAKSIIKALADNPIVLGLLLLGWVKAKVRT